VIAVGTRGTDSGRLVAMATAQPAFNMATAASVAATTTATTASPSDLVGGVVGGGGGSGGGGNQQGQQGVSTAATVTVVTSPPSQQQQQQASQQAIVSANSVSITAVTHQTLQQVRDLVFSSSKATQVTSSYCLGKHLSVQGMYPYLAHSRDLVHRTMV